MKLIMSITKMILIQYQKSILVKIKIQDAINFLKNKSIERKKYVVF